MKYQNLKSFQKHLASAAPDHLCRVYFIAIQDDFERTQVFDAILSYLETPPIRFSGVDCDLRTCLDAVHSGSLLGHSIVVLDEVEKLSKKQMQILCGHLGLPAGYLLLGARSKTPLAPFAEKEGVILDLLEEKPWDKEKRVAEQLADRAKNRGKKLASDAIPLFFERLGMDVALLENEVDKLISYTGDRTVITREDIFAISPASRASTLWQTAEEVIWERGDFPLVEAATFHGVIPVLRHQLHLGLTLATLIEEKCPPDLWSRFLPKLWSKTLEKRSSQAAHLGSFYFRKGLDKLFEIELLSRSNSTQYRALLDLFRAQLHAR